MNKKEFLEYLNKAEIEERKLREVSRLYSSEVVDEVAKAISITGKVAFFDEERRVLSFDEILDSSSLLGIDAVKEGILPVIDAYDCTYIVYLIKEKKWAKYSTVDKVIYKKKDSIDKVI